MFLEIFKIFFKVFIFILFGPRSQALLLLDGTPNQLTNEPQPSLLVALPLPSCCRLAAVLLDLVKLRGSEEARVAGLGFRLIGRLCNWCDHCEHNLGLLRGAEGIHTGKQRGKHFSALLAHTLPPSLCTNTRVCCAALKHTVVSLPCS
jgi:hypothetical protein